MHIEVSQATQQMGANTRRKFRDDEMDWILNKSQDRLIELNSTKTKTANGFEASRVAVDKLRQLIYVRDMSVYLNDVTNGYSPLPPLYAHSLSSSSMVYQLCNTARPAAEAITYKLTRFKFPQTLKVATPYYTEVLIDKMTDPVQTVFQLSAYVLGIAEKPWTGLQTKAEIFVIRDVVMQQFYRLGIPVYWERYDGNYYPGEMIIVTNDTYRLTIDTFVLTSVTETITRSGYVHAGTWKPNRLYSSADDRSMRATAFSDTYYQSPVTTIQQDWLNVHMDDSFIVSKTGMTYIRKPRRISLVLGQDSELSNDGIAQEVCDLASEYIQKLIADPNWEIKLRDNIQRTTI